MMAGIGFRLEWVQLKELRQGGGFLGLAEIINDDGAKVREDFQIAQPDFKILIQLLSASQAL